MTPRLSAAMPAAFVAVAAVTLACGLPARAADPPGRPDPLDPRSPVAQPAYRSAFDGYDGYAPATVRAWRESNAAVGRAGGWRAYLKESQAEAPPAGARPADAMPADAAPAAPSPRGDDASGGAPAPHKMHGHGMPGMPGQGGRP